MHKQSLDGAWQLCYCKIGEYTYAQALKILKESKLTCPVPGSVYIGLQDAGIIENPLEKGHGASCKFIEEQDFWYQTTFSIDTILEDEQTVLYFDGLDLDACIYVNDINVGHSENAFLRAEIDITKVLKQGINSVVVRINEGLNSVKDKSIDYMKYSWNKEEIYRTWLRKPQYCYGWDWAKRLSTCGIYQNVYIKRYQVAHFVDVNITTLFSTTRDRAVLTINPDIAMLAQKDISVSCSIFTDERYEQSDCIVKTEIYGNPDLININIENPALWWPNGYGEQYLYKILLTIADCDGTILDTYEVNYGLRSIELDQSAINATDKHFTFKVNGVPIFAKGGNWVPIEQAGGRASSQKYEALVKDAVAMNMNMFRVWGGGLYEVEDFFDYCDKYGILVWHDFMFACGYYPDFDDDFVATVAAEATYQVKRLRNRSCFIGWSGNNENYSMYAGLVKHLGEVSEFHGKKIYEEILPAICKKYDPIREYRHSSPFGGDNPDSSCEGDQHSWACNQIGTTDYMNLFKYPDMPCKFLSEFGILGPMNLESLVRCTDEDQRYPLSEQWLYHSNVGDYFDTVCERFFGIEQASKSVPLAQYILMCQAIQAECIRYIFEEYRSRKFECSGILLWMYSDCFPTSGWTFVDYYLNKKPLYYYTQRAFSPVSITFKGYVPNLFENMASYQQYYKSNVAPIKIVLTNDTLESVCGTMNLKLMTLDGKLLEEATRTYNIISNFAEQVYSYDVSPFLKTNEAENLVLICTTTDTNGNTTENRYFFTPFKTLQLKKADINIEMKQFDEYLELTITSKQYVWLMHLAQPTDITFSDNDFDIYPGVTRRIKVLNGDINTFKPDIISMNPIK